MNLESLVLDSQGLSGWIDRNRMVVRLLEQAERDGEESARRSAGLLPMAGWHGHKYAIDAMVAEVALRLPPPVAMLTSDVDDMVRLCGRRVRLIAL